MTRAKEELSEWPVWLSYLPGDTNSPGQTGETGKLIRCTQLLRPEDSLDSSKEVALTRERKERSARSVVLSLPKAATL